jgi:hypothetical protein
MLPPEQPAYDVQGEVVEKIYFDANMMNERDNKTTGMTNEQYEAQRAVVKAVLFPPVVKQGLERQPAGDEFVIFPAQVLVEKQELGRAKDKQRTKREVSAEPDAMEVDRPAPSTTTTVAGMPPEMGGMF